jgi:hypothetical protein
VVLQYIPRDTACMDEVLQEIEQLGAFAKPDFGLSWGGHGGNGQAAVASMIFTLALAPTRVAPAAAMFFRSSSVLMPPEAFTPMFGPTAARIKAICHWDGDAELLFGALKTCGFIVQNPTNLRVS